MVKQVKSTNTEKEKTKKTNNIKKKENQKTKDSKVGIFKRIGNWFKTVFKEVSKVKWPSKKEMVKYSLATIVFIVFFALFFYVIEMVMALVKSLI